jgi:hypothetical protein
VTEEVKEETPKVVSLAQWEKKGVHTITTHSGSVVEIRLPDLVELIETNVIPQHLLETATRVANAAQTGTVPEVSLEQLLQQRDFVNAVTVAALVNPKVTNETVSKVPIEDRELITQIATRSRDRDAVGDHIGGLHESEKWRRFRQVGEFDPTVAGLEGFG